MISPFDLTCNITLYGSAKTSRDGRQIAVPWPTLVEALTTFRPRVEKTDAACWAPHSLLAGNRRKIANIKEVSLLVLDFDTVGSTVELASGLFPGRESVAHASYSATNAHQKCRLVLPLEAPIPANVWPRVYRMALRALSLPADRMCSDASRLFLLPVQPADPAVAVFKHTTGALLDLRPLAALAQQEEATEAAKAALRSRTRRVEWEHLARVAQSKTPLARRAHARLLAQDPQAREALAEALDATITVRAEGRIATRVPCPSCGRHSVWWAIDNTRASSAFCNHTNSCGWMGSLLSLVPETV